MHLTITEFIVAALAVWRVTHLLHAEDGPFDVFAHLRRWIGHGAWGKMFDCFYCLSVWVAAPLACAIGAGWKDRALAWPAISGAAILLQRAASPQAKQARLWFEEEEMEEELETRR